MWRSFNGCISYLQLRKLSLSFITPRLVVSSIWAQAAQNILELQNEMSSGQRRTACPEGGVHHAGLSVLDPTWKRISRAETGFQDTVSDYIIADRAV